MSEEIPKIYCLSGLGVDERAFVNIHLAETELVHIPWVDPLPKETLPAYAKRLMETVQLPAHCNLLGLSFGGMIATEIAKIHPIKNLILVSSISRSSQIPFKFRIAQFFGLHRLTPAAVLKSSNFITHYFFGTKEGKHKKLLKEILRDTDPHFLRWAIRAMLLWKNDQEPKCARIHGSKDRLLPLKGNCDHYLEGAGHFLLVTHGKEVSTVLQKILLNN